MYKNKLFLFVLEIYFNRLRKICHPSADIIVQYFKFTPINEQIQKNAQK